MMEREKSAQSVSTTCKKDAVKTFSEQTKVLISLASAFVIAPAAALAVIGNINHALFVLGELAFVFSVFFGYIVFGTLAGSQHNGEYNVYRKATRYSSIIQILLFLAGLVLFMVMVIEATPKGN